MFNMPRIPRLRMNSWVVGRVFRVLFGLVFIYVGINMAGDFVRNNSNINQPLKDAVHRYDAVGIVNSVVSDVGNAISDSFEADENKPLTAENINDHALRASSSLEGRFREKMPQVNAAFEDVARAAITPFQEAIKTQAQKTAKN